MELEIIIALIALSGIFFSALFAVLSYLYKSNLETKRSGRRLLYLLLELRHTIVTSLYDPKDITKQYLARCEEFFNKAEPGIDHKEIVDSVEHIIYEQIASMVMIAHTETSEKLLAEYEHELLNFSAINPVLAYRLKGKHVIKKFASSTIEYLNSANQKLSEVTDMKESLTALDPVAEKYKNDTIDDLIKDLNDNIIELATYCGRRDLSASKKVLTSSIIPGKRIDFGELDTEFSQLLTQINEALNHRSDKLKAE